MKALWVALAALVLGIAGGLGAVAYANGPTPTTYGGYQVVTQEATVTFSSTSAQVTATCPDASWSVTGGGYTTANLRTVVVDNQDVEDANGVSGWYVAAVNTLASGNLTAYAICTKLG